MGEKKQKQQTKNWIKALVVIACVTFVVLMVLSGMGSGWISFFSVIKPGDTVTLDFTIRDQNDQPLVTTDQQLYRQMTSSVGGIFFSKQLVLQANQSSVKAVMPIPIYTTQSGWSTSFALFGGEYDAISEGIIGMKQNEQKTIRIPFSDSMSQVWSAAQLKRNGLNLSDVNVGDSLAMGVTDSPDLARNTSSQVFYMRIGEVTQKAADGVTIDFGYPTIDVRIFSINKP
jgi:FKBP-type peptidyl-prolyl cis-trans isomerase 2